MHFCAPHASWMEARVRKIVAALGKMLRGWSYGAGARVSAVARYPRAAATLLVPRRLHGAVVVAMGGVGC